LKNISVIGAGSWGTTIANLLSRKGYNVLLYVYEHDLFLLMKSNGVNERYLPEIKLSNRLNFTNDLLETFNFSDIIVLAVPSHTLRSVLTSISDKKKSSKIYINLAKGIENNTLQGMSNVIYEVTGAPTKNIVTLSGPSHAEEVSRGIATAVVAACCDLKTARLVRDIFRTDFFRVYSSTDITGVELGGSLKNVIAIAAGIADGAGFGDNTKAALLTRALVEMTRLGVKMGAELQTFSGLSGMGDLIVTCMSRHSRNRFVGEEIGKGKSLDLILSEMVMVAEGVKTTKSVFELSNKFSVETPISLQVYEALFNKKNPHNAVKDLMTRDPKEEKV
jgi:glycerol-3-phosphate dehydrogenase (NAD(P)+)